MKVGPSGILLFDKPAGPTSHDIVDLGRRALGTRRVGHAGTLDPFATGLLLLLVGPTTRLSEYFTGMEKCYNAVVRLGMITDTDDATGSELSVSDAWTGLVREAVEEAAGTLVGTVLQIPPRYSAKKKGGERLYAKARRGESVAPEPVEVQVHELDITSFEPPDVGLRVRCSSGTYVRAIGRDLGARLGVGGHLTALRRTRIGCLDVADAASPDDLQASDPASLLLNPVAGLSHLTSFQLRAEERDQLIHVRPIPYEHPASPSEPLLALIGERLLAVGFVAGGVFRPRKVFSEDGS